MVKIYTYSKHMPFGTRHTVSWEGGGTPFGKALPKGGTFFKHHVFERVRKSVILVIKKGLKGLTDAFYGCEKVKVNVPVL